jgi:hypothetical protein
MRRMLLGILLALPAVAPLASAEQRRNLSIEDVISGFAEEKLFYFELLLKDGKYIEGSDTCWDSSPAAAVLVRQSCKKNRKFKNVFECSGDNQVMHVWFVYENAAQCEEFRKPMKDRMDVIRSQ